MFTKQDFSPKFHQFYKLFDKIFIKILFNWQNNTSSYFTRIKYVKQTSHLENIKYHWQELTNNFQLSSSQKKKIFLNILLVSSLSFDTFAVISLPPYINSKWEKGKEFLFVPHLPPFLFASFAFRTINFFFRIKIIINFLLISFSLPFFYFTAACFLALRQYLNYRNFHSSTKKKNEKENFIHLMVQLWKIHYNKEEKTTLNEHIMSH